MIILIRKPFECHPLRGWPWITAWGFWLVVSITLVRCHSRISRDISFQCIILTFHLLLLLLRYMMLIKPRMVMPGSCRTLSTGLARIQPITTSIITLRNKININLQIIHPYYIYITISRMSVCESILMCVLPSEPNQLPTDFWFCAFLILALCVFLYRARVAVGVSWVAICKQVKYGKVRCKISLWVVSNHMKWVPTYSKIL